jgi:hypothetical protein
MSVKMQIDESPQEDAKFGDNDVLYRIPVFLSQDLAQSLYLLQYPLRPADRPYEKDLGM